MTVSNRANVNKPHWGNRNHWRPINAFVFLLGLNASLLLAAPIQAIDTSSGSKGAATKVWELSYGGDTFVVRETIGRDISIDGVTATYHHLDSRGNTTTTLRGVDEHGHFEVVGWEAKEAAHLPENRQYLLKFPLELGTQWNSRQYFYPQSQSLNLAGKHGNQRPQAIYVDRPSVRSMTLNHQIVALDESITVPAGTYGGCMKVQTKGIFHSRVSQRDDPAQRTTYRYLRIDWWAPGVGIIRTVTTEDSDNVSRNQLRESSIHLVSSTQTTSPSQ